MFKRLLSNKQMNKLLTKKIYSHGIISYTFESESALKALLTLIAMSGAVTTIFLLAVAL
jgi:hypothetical protein